MHLLYTKKYLSIQKHIIICVFTCLLFFSCTACGSHESLNVESKTHSSEEIGQKEQIINIETINSSNSESKKTEHITLTTNTSTTEFILNKKYDTIFISPKSHWYVETMEIPSRIVDAKTGALYKAERSFDIYRDELQREYFFLEGTAIQCGFKDKYVYGIHVDEKNFLTKDEIIELSDELVHKIKPDHNYTLISCEYYETEKIYCIRYNFMIEGINTDDDLLIYMRGDGTIGAYTSYNMNKYDQIKLELKTDLAWIINEYKQNDLLDIKNIFISKYDEILYLVIEASSKEGSEVKQYLNIIH